MKAVLDLQNNYQKRSLRLTIIIHVFALGLLIFSFVFQSTGGKNNASSRKVMRAVTVNAKEFRAMLPNPHPISKKQKFIVHKPVVERKKVAPKPVLHSHKVNIKPVHKKEAITLKPIKHKVAEKSVPKIKSESGSKTTTKKTTVKQKTTKPKINLSAEKQLLENQLNNEAAALSNVHYAKLQTEIDKYKALILNAIGQQWIMPEHFDKNLKTELLIHLVPGGMVLNVDMLKSSGDSVLDHSVINAVWKASPLPVPEDKNLFENFRTLHLTVRPEGFLS